MSDIQTLIEMGFPESRAKRALEVTNFKGVEPAMEWLLAHCDEDIPIVAEQVNQNVIQEEQQDPSSLCTDATGSTLTTNESNEDDQKAQQEAKSLKCDDCNKLFTNQSQVEFHAAKTGHSNFSESTEEKKPLTEEERKAQLELIEAKLRQRRAEREERERLDELEREKNRIKSGKDMTEAKKRMEELEMQKIVEQRKREKAEEKAARDRVRAQIEADKAARKAKMAVEQGKPIQSPVTSTTTTIVSLESGSNASGSQQPKKDYTTTRIQIRLQDGSTITETFNVKEQLSAVRVFIQVKQGGGDDLPFGLMTSFPRKVFTDEDYEKPLEVLGLVPSAVIIVTKAR